MMKFKYLYIFLVISIITLTNCETDGDYPTGDFTIREIEISPYPVPAGGIATFTVIIDNPNNEELSYDWDIDGGTIIGSDRVVQWEAPTFPDVYTLTLTVTGKSGMDVEEKYIEVI